MKESLLLKSEEFVCKDLGIVPKERSIFELIEKGFLIIDKDSGPTSHQTTDYVKGVIECSKAGHSGTLDPKVTGVLVLGLGKGTRLMEYMLKSDKVYVCLMYVHKPVPKAKIEETLKKFTGTIMQLPPIVSAVKRELRPRTIYSIDLLDYKDEGQNILFKVSCQHGTYIRKLCSDIGEFLSVGSQMVELRRTKAGPFTENDGIISVDKLRNLFNLYLMSKDKSFEGGVSPYETELRKYLRPMEDLIFDFKKVYVHDTAVDSLSHGYDLMIPGISYYSEGIKEGEDVVIFTSKGELIAIGKAQCSSDFVAKNEKGVFVKTNKVFMDVGYYPDIEYFNEKYPMEMAEFKAKK